MCKNDSGIRDVTQAEGDELARTYKINPLETSAKTGENVDEAFNQVIRTIYQHVFHVSASLPVKSPTTGIVDPHSDRSEKPCCRGS